MPRDELAKPAAIPLVDNLSGTVTKKMARVG